MGSLEIPLLSLAGGGQDQGGAHHHPQLRLGLRPPGLHPARHPRRLLLLPRRRVRSPVGPAGAGSQIHHSLQNIRRINSKSLDLKSLGIHFNISGKKA